MNRAFTLAEFKSSNGMLDAARKLRESGVRDLDGYAPYPVEGLEEALGIPKSRVPLIVLIAGLTGAISGYLMQWWMNSIDFAINVGGRPPHAPPSFVPITFELGVLIGSFGAFFGLWTLCKLPRLHHPVFEVSEFRSASVDRFWLSVSTPPDAELERKKIETHLQELGAELVKTVEGEP
jgi:hypothetical protein